MPPKYISEYGLKSNFHAVLKTPSSQDFRVNVPGLSDYGHRKRRLPVRMPRELELAAGVVESQDAGSEKCREIKVFLHVI